MWSNRRVSSSIALAAFIAIAGARRAASHETVNTTVLFDREIVRILNSHCVMCHTEGGPSFPLATYEDVWLQRRKISAAVIARHMPPWPAFAGYGRFANENAVTLRESQFIVSWMEGLGPRNAGKVFTNVSDPAAPKPQPVRAHAEFGVWHLGQPDLVRALGSSAVIDLGLTRERLVRAIEYMPGDRRAVHSATFTIQETGQWIGSWTPWYGFRELPRAMAFRVPAGAHLVADIQYAKGSMLPPADRGRVGVFFDAKPGSRAVSDLIVDARGTKRLYGEVTLASETTLLAFRPDVAPGIATVEISARKPDGGTDVLLFAKDFSPDWATPFICAEPVTLPRGTVLAVTAYGTAGSLKTTISTVSSGPAPRTSTRPVRRSR